MAAANFWQTHSPSGLAWSGGWRPAALTVCIHRTNRVNFRATLVDGAERWAGLNGCSKFAQSNPITGNFPVSNFNTWIESQLKNTTTSGRLRAIWQSHKQMWLSRALSYLTANLLENLAVKKFCTLFKIWQNYGHEYMWPRFLAHTVGRHILV